MSKYKERNTGTMMWLPNALYSELKRQATLHEVPMRTILIRALSRYLYEGESA